MPRAYTLPNLMSYVVACGMVGLLPLASPYAASRGGRPSFRLGFGADLGMDSDEFGWIWDGCGWVWNGSGDGLGWSWMDLGRIWSDCRRLLVWQGRDEGHGQDDADGAHDGHRRLRSLGLRWEGRRRRPACPPSPAPPSQSALSPPAAGTSHAPKIRVPCLHAACFCRSLELVEIFAPFSQISTQLIHCVQAEIRISANLRNNCTGKRRTHLKKLARDISYPQPNHSRSTRRKVLGGEGVGLRSAERAACANHVTQDADMRSAGASPVQGNPSGKDRPKCHPLPVNLRLGSSRHRKGCSVVRARGTRQPCNSEHRYEKH